MEKGASAAETRFTRYYAAHREQVIARSSLAKSCLEREGRRLVRHCLATGETDLGAAAEALNVLGALRADGCNASPLRAVKWAAERLPAARERKTQAEVKKATKEREREETRERRKIISQELAAARRLAKNEWHRRMRQRRSEATREAREQAAKERAEARKAERERRRQEARDALAAERAAKGYKVLYIKPRGFQKHPGSVEGGTYA